MSIKQKGFTLIELLVVIAIIGILSAIVLSSLDTARNKGADGATESDLAGMASQAENYYDAHSPNTYAGVCADGTTGINNMLVGAQTASGATSTMNLDDTVAGSASTVTCHDGVTGWAAEAPLKALAGKFWCIDSTGSSTSHTTNIAANALTCTPG